LLKHQLYVCNIKRQNYIYAISRGRKINDRYGITAKISSDLTAESIHVCVNIGLDITLSEAKFKLQQGCIKIKVYAFNICMCTYEKNICYFNVSIIAHNAYYYVHI
jgi:hypothetical protein